MGVSVIWKGSPPSSGILVALGEANLSLLRSGADDSEAPLVIATSTTRIPTVLKAGRRWIWLSAREVGEAEVIEATLRGAYAVIASRSPAAAADLVTRLKELLTPEPSLTVPPDLVMTSPASHRAVAHAAGVAATSMPVLLTGETGTGKEVLARLIHAWSRRAVKPFVPINCAAIPDELMEAELFGYARGAFSGAVQRYEGQLTAAEGGTVFLDEVDDTPLATQVKLLRVLEDHVVSRLGESVWHRVDFRVIAATNRDLRTLIRAGLFGADLYERLATVTIRLVPLRERLEDLPALAHHFMRRFAGEQERPPMQGIAPDALRALSRYPWPGNIRELRNVLYETLVYKRAGDEILLSDLPRRVLRRGARSDTDTVVDRLALGRAIEGGTMSLRDQVAALERLAIEEALKRSGGNAAQAARLLGRVGRGVARDPGGTLRAMMRRLGGKSDETPVAGQQSYGPTRSSRPQTGRRVIHR
jgi:DNA-binding NtrC family response regulator